MSAEPGTVVTARTGRCWLVAVFRLARWLRIRLRCRTQDRWGRLVPRRGCVGDVIMLDRELVGEARDVPARPTGTGIASHRSSTARPSATDWRLLPRLSDRSPTTGGRNTAFRRVAEGCWVNHLQKFHNPHNGMKDSGV